jgi:tRNA threonylcarbamoyladenosine biosynthesis protein TsaE
VKKNIQSIADLDSFAKEILNFAPDQKVFLFKGDLGTGKTTFIKKICEELGVEGQTSSPTYSIVNEYLSPEGKIYHIDLYRLNSAAEAFEVGLEDYLYSTNYCFVEWPQIAKELLPDSYVEVSIIKESENSRMFNITLID